MDEDGDTWVRNRVDPDGRLSVVRLIGIAGGFMITAFAYLRFNWYFSGRNPPSGEWFESIALLLVVAFLIGTCIASLLMVYRRVYDREFRKRDVIATTVIQSMIPATVVLIVFVATGIEIWLGVVSDSITGGLVGLFFPAVYAGFGVVTAVPVFLLIFAGSAGGSLATHGVALLHSR